MLSVILKKCDWGEGVSECGMSLFGLDLVFVFLSSLI